VKRVAALETEKTVKLKNSLSVGNGTATVFWDCTEMIGVDAMPRRESIILDA